MNNDKMDDTIPTKYKVQEDYRIHVHDQSCTSIWKLKQGKASEAKFEGRQ